MGESRKNTAPWSQSALPSLGSASNRPEQVSPLRGSLPALPLGRTNWDGKTNGPRRQKQDVPSNRYPAHEGAWSWTSPILPIKLTLHSQTLEVNFLKPLCSISISGQPTINGCDRKASFYDCTISAIHGSNIGPLCQSLRLDAVQLLFQRKAPPSWPPDTSAPSHDICQSSAPFLSRSLRSKGKHSPKGNFSNVQIQMDF